MNAMQNKIQGKIMDAVPDGYYQKVSNYRLFFSYAFQYLDIALGFGVMYFAYSVTLVPVTVVLIVLQCIERVLAMIYMIKKSPFNCCIDLICCILFLDYIAIFCDCGAWDKKLNGKSEDVQKGTKYFVLHNLKIIRWISISVPAAFCAAFVSTYQLANGVNGGFGTLICCFLICLNITMGNAEFYTLNVEGVTTKMEVWCWINILREVFGRSLAFGVLLIGTIIAAVVIVVELIVIILIECCTTLIYKKQQLDHESLKDKAKGLVMGAIKSNPCFLIAMGLLRMYATVMYARSDQMCHGCYILDDWHAALQMNNRRYELLPGINKSIKDMVYIPLKVIDTIVYIGIGAYALSSLEWVKPIGYVNVAIAGILWFIQLIWMIYFCCSRSKKKTENKYIPGMPN